MTAAITLTHDIRAVEGTEPEADGLRVEFKGGTVARLLAAHPDFAAIRVALDDALRRGRPVGIVSAADGEIIDLNVCHESAVRSVDPMADGPGRLQVAFWAYPTICGLTREQGDFARIRALLVAAAGSGQPVRFALHTTETVDEEPDEDGVVGTLPKVMDVQPT